jgi:integration host factor subunit beta
MVLLHYRLTNESALATFPGGQEIGISSTSGRLHLHGRDVEKVVTTVLEEISAALARRNRVELRGFGSFTVKVRSARPGRNPKTGNLVSVPENGPSAFRTGRDMHRRLNADLLQ